jgi:hypothetical protein
MTALGLYTEVAGILRTVHSTTVTVTAPVFASNHKTAVTTLNLCTEVVRVLHTMDWIAVTALALDIGRHRTIIALVLDIDHRAIAAPVLLAYHKMAGTALATARFLIIVDHKMVVMAAALVVDHRMIVATPALVVGHQMTVIELLQSLVMTIATVQGIDTGRIP